MSTTLAERLLLHHWPMNVRELRATAQRLVLLDPADGPITRWPGQEPPAAEPLTDSTPSASLGRGGPPAGELRALLREHAGSVARLAEHYGKARRQIYRWLERHGIDPDTFR